MLKLLSLMWELEGVKGSKRKLKVLLKDHTCYLLSCDVIREVKTLSDYVDKVLKS